MRYGFVLPGGPATRQLQQAEAAEAAGWDGVLVWEAAYGVDAWALLAAMAARTTTVRLGTLLTPAPWRRPWKLASQVATVDQLSAGRAFVTLGLGALADDLPTAAGEPTDRRERAARMDETIDLMRALWAGKGEYHGEHYDITSSDWLDDMVRPVQQPVPIWVAAAWPRPRSMRRALRCEGMVPEYHLGRREQTPDDLRDLTGWLRDNGAPQAIDVLAEGETPGDDAAGAAAQVEPWRAAGATWWMEERWGSAGSLDERMEAVDARIAAGPPRAA